MTDTQYRVVMDLFIEYNKAFHSLPPHITAAFYDRLYAK
jgi:hypothetical protein